MKIYYILLLGAATLLPLSSCGHKEENELAHHHHDHGHEGHNHEGHNHGAEEAEHDGAIVLEPAVAAKFGLQTVKTTLAPFSQVIKVSGTVQPSTDGYAVVSASTSGILTLSSGINVGTEVSRGALIGTVKSAGVTGGDPNRVARAELDAAKTEYDRVAALWNDRLVTRAQYDAAKAAYERAKAAYSAPAASGSVTAPITGVIISVDAASGQYVETGAAIATVSTSRRVNVRADVPAKYAGMLPQVNDARIVVPYSGAQVLASELDGKRVGAGSAAAGSAGYIPLIFSLSNNGVLTPGTSVEMYLLVPSERKAISVPRDALVEQQGNYFVYVRLDEDCYRKQPVTIGASDGASVEILSGIKQGENIVVKGATAVRLAESSGNIPEGHSHSH